MESLDFDLDATIAQLTGTLGDSTQGTLTSSLSGLELMDSSSLLQLQTETEELDQDTEEDEGIPEEVG